MKINEKFLPGFLCLVYTGTLKLTPKIIRHHIIYRKIIECNLNLNSICNQYLTGFLMGYAQESTTLKVWLPVLYINFYFMWENIAKFARPLSSPIFLPEPIIKIKCIWYIIILIIYILIVKSSATNNLFTVNSEIKLLRV